MSITLKDVYYKHTPPMPMINPLEPEVIAQKIKNKEGFKAFLLECYHYTFHGRATGWINEENIKTALELKDLQVPLYVTVKGGLLIIDNDFNIEFSENFIK